LGGKFTASDRYEYPTRYSCSLHPPRRLRGLAVQPQSRGV
jgi:hypothetical protein